MPEALVVGLAWRVVLGIAAASEPYLETDPLATREEAAALAQAGVEAGCPADVVRRYLKGQGWMYVVRLDARLDPATQAACAQGAWGTSVGLRASPGERGRPSTPPPATAGAVDAAALPWTLDEVLSRLVRAHDGASGGAEGAGTVLFRFERSTPGGARVEHTYVRRGDDRYLRIDVRDGEGVSSRSGVVGGTAWLEGSSATLDPAMVRAQVDRFSPRAVLQLASVLAGGALDLPERSLLRIAGVHQDADGEFVVVGTEGDRTSQPLRLEIDTRTWRLRNVARGPEGAQVSWHYKGWRETEDGALRPVRVEVRRGASVLDVVEVTELELSPVLPEEWFRVPTP